MVECSWEQYLAEFVETFLTDDPLRGFQGAARETFAAARGVPQGDGVGSGIEADFVGAGMRTGATGGYIDGPLEARVLHVRDQLQQSAGRRILFGGVVN